MIATTSADPKQVVGRAAALLVNPNTIIGCGTGSTAVHFVKAVGERMQREGFSVKAITTSLSTEDICRDVGIAVLSPRGDEKIDITVDGADEWTERGEIIKGAGGAIYQEKQVAIQCLETGGKFIIVVDANKKVDRLGEKYPVPVEVDPRSYARIRSRLEQDPDITEVTLRLSKGGLYGPVITRNGNFLLDVKLSRVRPEHHSEIKNLCGVVETGIFSGLASLVLVGQDNGQIVEYRRSGLGGELTLAPSPR